MGERQNGERAPLPLLKPLSVLQEIDSSDYTVSSGIKSNPQFDTVSTKGLLKVRTVIIGTLRIN